jgi:hypothetical protein
MDEFPSIGSGAMSDNETPKVEPKFEASPSIVPETTSEKTTAETKSDVKVEATADATAEAPADKLPEAPKLASAPKAEVETKPEANSKPEATVTFLPAIRKPDAKREDASFKAAGPEIVMKPRGSARFGLLAACIAIAASFGAVAGSLSVAKLGPMFAPPPPATVVQAPVKDEALAAEVKALRDTITQLRTATRTLGENFAALKSSTTTANASQNQQIAKLSESMERVEKAEQRRAAAPTTTTAAVAASRQAAASDVTGSIAAKPQSTLAPGPGATPEAQAAALRPSVVQGWVLRRVYDGAALIEGRDGIIEVEPGDVAPGLGRIEAIKRQDGRWTVVTARGIVVGR